MANLFEGIFHLIQGFFQSIFAIIQSIFHVIWSIFSGVFQAVWGILESIADLVGASAHFVASNILVLGLIALIYVLYRDRNRPGSAGNELKKKVQ
ncbi:hypothetical protein BD324DRAFT_627300 [Kockovaella imperatae]|uniref:Uncharacterized protein n=1 Tax=Kockovaella imperatae TaxID=4999 RepID=A0A1Y1UFH8_9TREE|nr:hypothetical protein BD324DRAFT_627300 [Kockovaella imperatae]ORX36820.1 hypothetical protein BD324DRAFT_627300 [Kockovaella imperatae]